MLQVYAKENDVEMLRDFYFQDDLRKETACLALEESVTIQVCVAFYSLLRLAFWPFVDIGDVGLWR